MKGTFSKLFDSLVEYKRMRKTIKELKKQVARKEKRNRELKEILYSDLCDDDKGRELIHHRNKYIDTFDREGLSMMNKLIDKFVD